MLSNMGSGLNPGLLAPQLPPSFLGALIGSSACNQLIPHPPPTTTHTPFKGKFYLEKLAPFPLGLGPCKCPVFRETDCL